MYKYFTSSSTVFIEISTFTGITKLLHHWEIPVQMLSGASGKSVKSAEHENKGYSTFTSVK